MTGLLRCMPESVHGGGIGWGGGAGIKFFCVSAEAIANNCMSISRLV